MEQFFYGFLYCSIVDDERCTIEQKQNAVSMYKNGKNLKQIQHAVRNVTKEMIIRWADELDREGNIRFTFEIICDQEI